MVRQSSQRDTPTPNPRERLRLRLPREVRSVLVIKLRQIGDVLLATPVFQALRQAFPAARLTACVNEGTEDVLHGNASVDRIIVVPKPGPRRKTREILSQLRRLSADLVLDLTGNDRAAFYTWWTRAPCRLTSEKPAGFLGKRLIYHWASQLGSEWHAVVRNLEPLKQLGIPCPDPQLEFPVSPADRAHAAKLLPGSGDYFQVSPVSRIANKCWPDPFTIDLIERLAATGLTPVLTGSPDPAELQRVRAIGGGLRVRHVDLSGRLSLKQLGAVSERARLFFGVDSAPMHIAAAVGTPTIGLFGPSSETLWRPWCRHHLVLSQDLPCRLPCQLKNTCPTIECLTTLTPDLAWPRVEAFLGSLRGFPACAASSS